MEIDLYGKGINNMIKNKKLLYRILKIVWALIGISISLFTFLIYLKMISPIGLGLIAWVILFTIGISSLIGYVVITILFLLIKFIVKKIRKK